MVQRWSPKGRLFHPVEIAPVVTFRIAFGILMFIEVLRYFHYGWIDRYFIEPSFFFPYFGISWITPLPGVGMFVVFVGLGVLSILISVGLWYRLSVALFFVGFSYIFLIDQARYLNHFYLIALMSFLMIFIPAARHYSVDSWRNRSIRSSIAPIWTLWLLRAQLGIVYFFGGIAKLNGDWLAGEPMRMWLTNRTDFPIIGSLFVEEWMVALFIYGGLLLDLLFLPLVLWKRTRIPMLLIAFGFHVMNAHLFSIGIFPWFMIVANLLFLDPKRHRWLLQRLGATVGEVGNVEHELTLRRAWVVASLMVYLAIQVALPLRHFLYPGDVNWTEEGHRFAWHMKLRSKSGTATFYVTDPQTQTSWVFNPDPHLTEYQYDVMVGRPDMILQFSHHIERLLLSEWEGEPPDLEVRAEVWVSLNGRPYQLIIDPRVDLTTVTRSLLIAEWILPLDSETLLVSD